MGNILKSLGPNDDLTTAVARLDVLLKAETSTVVSLISKRTFELKESIATVLEAGVASNANLNEIKELLKGQGLRLI